MFGRTFVALLFLLIALVVRFYELDFEGLEWKVRHSHERYLWPFPANKLVPTFRKVSWGTHRPGLYFGLRQTLPQSTLAGLMWTHPEDRDALQSIRHEARQEHGLDRWGWDVHDGSSYGRQTLEDRGLRLEIRWALIDTNQSDDGEWTVEIQASSLNATRRRETSLFLYVGEEDIDRRVEVDLVDDGAWALRGSGNSGAGWCASLRTRGSAPSVVEKHYVRVRTADFHSLGNVVAEGLRYSLMQQRARGAPNGYSLELPNLSEEDSNVGIVQVSGGLPFSVEMTFRKGGGAMVPNDVDPSMLFLQREAAFEAKFNATFPHLISDDVYGGSNGDGDSMALQQYRVSKYALSNMLGGIGYWYGSSLVEVDLDRQVELWKAPLLSAVPSRSFFPRGFLWDEGFHQLLIRRWDPAISRVILAHWLDLMTASGWIPREQILGQESRSRVPKEFIAQHPSAANPPTLFLVLSDMALNGTEEDVKFLKKAWPRLDRWFRWYNTTQFGRLPGSYRWRGRDSKALHELNPKTLTSGLDDYPRASHPSEDERHVDLRCWMALAARTMSRIHSRVFEDGSSKPWKRSIYAELANSLENYEILKSLHWDPARRVFADYGLDTPDMVLQDGRRVLERNGSLPELGFISQHVGYVTMFPLALGMIPLDAPELSDVLDVLDSPEHMWSPHGLRSLSSSSPIYGEWNTNDDAPYWRGAIWINMNYLILEALRTTYAEHPRASILARSLRENLVTTIGKQFDERGFIYENYDDKTGEGRGCFPFTGWSALVTLV